MLVEEIKKQGKPYGLVFKDAFGGSTNTSSFGYQAFKGVPRRVYRYTPTAKKNLSGALKWWALRFRALIRYLRQATNQRFSTAIAAPRAAIFRQRHFARHSFRRNRTPALPKGIRKAAHSPKPGSKKEKEKK